MYSTNGLVAAGQDFRDGVRLSPLWLRLALEQTRQRYSRSLLGPFWLASTTIANGIAFTIVFGAIFGGSWQENMAFILAGVTAWYLIAGMLNEAPTMFTSGAGMMQIQRTPLTFHAFLHAQKLLINFGHQLPAFWLVLAVTGLWITPHWHLLLALPVVTAACFFLSIPLALVATRYRDVAYMTGFIMQILFVLSPVFWRRAQVGDNMRWLVDFNPFSHLLELMRHPLVGEPTLAIDWVWSLSVLVLAALLAYVSLALYRRRVIFWL